jgi:hypothetical protein
LNQQFLADTRMLCLRTLDDPGLQKVAAQAANDALDISKLLNQVTWTAGSTSPLVAWRERMTAGPHEFERWLILAAALQALPALEEAPVTGEVKDLWLEEIRRVAEPPANWSQFLKLEHSRFREMARLVTLRRWPAGQFHWEAGGLPGTAAMRTPARQLPALAKVLLETGGRDCFAEIHTNENRKNRFTLTAAEGLKSFRHIALSLELQPKTRGIFSYGWLTCESTAEVVPRLAWMREFFLAQGAFLASTEEAPADAGFLTGSEERRKLYEEGKFRPRMTYVIWPRKRAIEWARSIS